MDFKLEIKCDNDSMYYDSSNLVAIIKDVAKKIEDGFSSGACLDYNGNRVGQFYFRK